jgi:hypothetical protein
MNHLVQWQQGGVEPRPVVAVIPNRDTFEVVLRHDELPMSDPETTRPNPESTLIALGMSCVGVPLGVDYGTSYSGLAVYRTKPIAQNTNLAEGYRWADVGLESASANFASWFRVLVKERPELLPRL